MKTTSALILSALLASSINGCTLVEYTNPIAGCSPPPRPALPTLSKGSMWDAYTDAYRQRGYGEEEAVKLGDAEYREVETYITRLNGYSKEQGAMLKALCASE